MMNPLVLRVALCGILSTDFIFNLAHMKKIIVGVIVGLAVTSFVAGAAYLHYFTDVPEGKWYTESVEFLKQVGVVSGYSDGTFKPGKDVTRAEISVMLTQAMAEMGHGYAACIAKPYTTDIGSLKYPVSNKYSTSYWLGSIFTAYECGNARLEELFGGLDGEYIARSVLTLWDAPSTDFRRVLETAGYSCDQEGVDPMMCMRWILDEDVPISTLIPLREFMHEVRQDDCLNCG